MPLPFLSPDQVLAFTKPTALALSRTDSLGGTVTFGLESLANAQVSTLLPNTSSGSAKALAYNSIVDGSWLASEGQALGSASAVPGSFAAGLWLPTATLNGANLALQSLQTDGNSALATFAGGYQATFTLGGSRSIANGGVIDDVAVTVRRVAEYNNGLAFYEADQRTGAITADGKTLSPGEPGYLQAALAKAQSAGLVLDASRLPAFGQQATFALPINDTKSYGLLLLVKNDPSTLFSSFAAANPGGAMQVVSLGSPGGGVTFGIEDTPVSSGASDRDYNDLIVTLGHAAFDPTH